MDSLTFFDYSLAIIHINKNTTFSYTHLKNDNSKMKLEKNIIPQKNGQILLIQEFYIINYLNCLIESII